MHQMQAAAAAAFSWQMTPPVALFASSLVTHGHVEPEKKEEEVHPKAAIAPDKCQPRTLLCVVSCIPLNAALPLPTCPHNQRFSVARLRQSLFPEGQSHSPRSHPYRREALPV